MKLYAFFIKIVLLIALSVCVFKNAYAAHIVGGEMYYEHVNGNTYRITMIIYRDCFGSGAGFDNPAEITIYETGSSIPFSSRSVSLASSTTIPVVTSNPCLIPPSNICVEQGVYTFTSELPFSVNGYTISYQRCCRNNTINNIFTPGDVGGTYTVNMSSAALAQNNSSARFNDFPPIVICSNTELEFDHSASDVNPGNTLVYSLCAPLEGGGPDLVNITSPGGVSPNPATPPPYTPVAFSPPFNVFNQIASMPQMSINPTTGLITGVPNALGQYVVGVCVDEYDASGSLLSTIRRDFQFNVVSCILTVFADINEDEITADQEYLIRSCGETELRIENQSGLAQYINDVLWEFDLNGQPFSSTDFDLNIDFQNLGIYNGLLIINPGSVGCTDTIAIRIEIYDELEANYTYSYDSCVVDSVYFMDNGSYSNNGAITSFYWDFMDGDSSNLQNPGHLFNAAGNFNVPLVITDVVGCTDTFTDNIEWFPAPIIDVSLASYLGCAPMSVAFDNNSFPINGYSTVWDFGDGGTSEEPNPRHIYEEAGVYTVTLNITSPTNCMSDTVFVDLITVLPSPTANFDYTPDNPSYLSPVVQFNDLSLNSVAWFWDFGGLENSFQQSPLYSFTDTGLISVSQIVTHPSGCKDTLSKVIDVLPNYTLFMPNAFTPNDDGVNDVFLPIGIPFGMKSYNLGIWNRWGEQVFQSSVPEDGWNGLKNNVGRTCKSGVYIYVVKVVGARGEKQEFKGFATLLR